MFNRNFCQTFYQKVCIHYLLIFNKIFYDTIGSDRSGNPFVPRLEFSLLLICLLIASAVLFPEFSYAAIGEIGDLKTLTKTVQDDVHGYAIPIILNAAGVGCAGYALLTQRWTMLIFGAAYLIFVNVFFGFVKGQFGVK